MGVMGTALFLWCAGPQLAGAAGWTAGEKLLSAPFVAVLWGWRHSSSPCAHEQSGKFEFSMTLEQAIRNISWHILLIMVGTITFGSVLLQGGVDSGAG